MNEGQPRVVAELTRDAEHRCRQIGGGALSAVRDLCAELEKNPRLGRRAGSVNGPMDIYTTRLEATGARPALTVSYVYDAPPPEPGLIRIALVSPAVISGER